MSDPLHDLLRQWVVVPIRKDWAKWDAEHQGSRTALTKSLARKVISSHPEFQKTAGDRYQHTNGSKVHISRDAYGGGSSVHLFDSKGQHSQIQIPTEEAKHWGKEANVGQLHSAVSAIAKGHAAPQPAVAPSRRQTGRVNYDQLRASIFQQPLHQAPLQHAFAKMESDVNSPLRQLLRRI